MDNMMIPKRIEILLVEDNPGDVVLFTEALEEIKVRTHLNIVDDGEEAVLFLKKEGQHQSAPKPNLIILDLNLPKLNGREVLQEIRSDPRFNPIPVVILTTSKSDKDMIEAYRLHANSYTVKPVDLNQFMTVLKELTRYWLEVACLPMEG